MVQCIVGVKPAVGPATSGKHHRRARLAGVLLGKAIANSL